MFKENISVDQNLEPGGTICFSAKWLGDKKTFFYSEWEDGRDVMIKAAFDFCQEADAIVGVNHKKFDIPHLMTEFALAGLGNPGPMTLIDVQQACKTHFRLLSNKLAFIGPFFNLGKKMEHEGFMLWRKVMVGDEKAQKRMKRYCIQDTKLTEKLYLFVRPFINNHPHMGVTKSRECGACGSSHVHVSKYRRTKSMRIQQLHCQDCGSYFDGTREKMT
jgi:hypothetical protein